MKSKIYMCTVVFVTLFAISAAAQADGPQGLPGGEILLGGMGGHGGMGGGMGGGMMGWGRGLSALLEYLSQKTTDRNQDLYKQKRTGELRKDIREKREELASLRRSKNPDEKLINQKIDELNRLELELDIRLRSQEERK